MKALRVHRYGDLSGLSVDDVPIPTCGDDEVLVRVAYAGVNMVDTYWRRGLPGYRAEALPFVPGLECGGIVVSVGRGVADLRVGDTVVGLMHRGTYAEYAAIPAAKVIAVPEGVDLASAVALSLQGFTAFALTHRVRRLQRGDRVLVHASAGGVGAHVAAYAASLGATVLGTCSSAEKERRALASGCDAVIRYDRQDFVEEVRKLTDGRGVDVVYDSVGARTFEGSLRCLRPRGLLCLFGQSSGEVAPFSPQLLREHGSLFLTRPSLTHYLQPREELVEMANAVFARDSPAYRSLNVRLFDSLEDVGRAQAQLESGRSTGKLVVAVRPAPESACP
jgi:NADPH:quinone reductase